MERHFVKKSICVVFCIVLLISCGGGGGDDTENVVLDDGDSEVESLLPIVIKTTDAQIVLTDSIPTNGGLMYVESSGSPIDGMMIDVPQYAYSETVDFTVSYSPIIEYGGNTYLKPVTPLITIDNNKKVANEIIMVKIPLKMEQDHHYMAFYYDRTTGEVEGIPEVEHDETSITIATTHFSEIFVNATAMSLLLDDFDSGHQVAAVSPGETGYQIRKDNWQFVNEGAYLSPGGLCSGMSKSSLYYYIERKKKLKQPQLFGLYNNNTSDFGIDDDLAIKLAATAQWYEDNLSINIDSSYWLDKQKEKNSDVWTFGQFAQAIALSHNPQYLSVYPDKGSGHALVVYRKFDNRLFLADPNKPKDETVNIEIDKNTGKFKPFLAGWNVATDPIFFTRFVYVGYSAVKRWSGVEELWKEMDAKTVGQDFPKYILKIIETDSSGKETERLLTGDSIKTEMNEIKIKIENDDFSVLEPRLNVYPTKNVLQGDKSEIVKIRLDPGQNRIGLHVEANKDYKFFDENNVEQERSDWTWTDFKYITIESGMSQTGESGSLIAVAIIPGYMGINFGSYSENIKVSLEKIFKEDGTPVKINIPTISAESGGDKLTIQLSSHLSGPGSYSKLGDIYRFVQDGEVLITFTTKHIQHEFPPVEPVLFFATLGEVVVEEYGIKVGDRIKGTFNVTIYGGQEKCATSACDSVLINPIEGSLEGTFNGIIK